MRVQIIRSLLAMSLVALGLPGCPALLTDDFDTTKPLRDASTDYNSDVSSSDSSGGSAGNASGGNGGLGGNAGASGVSGNGGSAGTDASSDADSASESSDDSGPVGCSNCTKTCCDGQCIDLLRDPSNCGACGKGCPGTVCSNGECTNECRFGFLDCDNNVVTGCEANAASDLDNCGSCGIACAFDATCTQGQCVCPVDTANCDGIKANGCETNLSEDPSNCGACRQTCGANQACSQSKCACAPGYADCNGRADDGCETSLTDPKTCGSCSNDCGVNAVCSGATCACSPDFLNCDGAPGCEAAKTDPAHCGTCDQQCGGATPVCNGTACVTGCTSTLTLCGSSCVDLQTDPTNCGACGKAVGPQQTCSAGKPTCLPDFADCNAQSGDGCETDTRSDVANCGGCSKTCKPGAVCAGSTCSCSASKPQDCGDACRECCNDNTQCNDGNACTQDQCSNGSCTSSLGCVTGKCCGGTGCYECCDDIDCQASGQVCSGNKCVTPNCVAPQVLCAGGCVDIGSNPNNCGGCGNVCAAGRSCAAQKCTPSWVAVSVPSTVIARSRAAATWTGSAVFVWGGSDGSARDLNSGFLYDPTKTGTAAWTSTSVDANTPSARVLATAVWTGSVVVVWGGGNRAGNADYNTGGRYDPATNTWQKMTLNGAPSARRAPFGVWTGSRVLFWGGFNKNGNAADRAYLYDPVNDVWSSATTTNDPGKLLDPAVAWSGTNLYVFGGSNSFIDNGSLTAYNPQTNSWTPLATGPSARDSAFAAWDGNSLVVWGGRKLLGAATDGMRYDPSSGLWSTVSTTGAPSTRMLTNREQGWAARVSAGETLVLGGFDPSASKSDTTTRKDGGIYNSTTNAWTAVPAWPSNQAHRFGVGVWMGSEFLLWGGETSGVPSNSGERFLP